MFQGCIEMKSFEERPLPLYGLVGAYSGGRYLDGEGWDTYTIVHRPGSGEGELTVGVDRRSTASSVRGPRIAISPELARESVATALALKLPNIGSEVFKVAAGLAHDSRAWRQCPMEIDGSIILGHEREYKSLWVAYCLTPTLIIYVLGSAALRTEVKLMKLEAHEVIRLWD